MTTEDFHSEPLTYVEPRFCPWCGGSLELRLIPEEDRTRHVCAGCARIHYVNPKVVAAVLPLHEGQVLLLRRAIQPRTGTWVFPGGFVEWGETTQQAAAREAAEEVGVALEVGPLLGVYSRLGPGVVIVVYLGRVIDPAISLGREALDAAWFAPEAIPWDELAFDTTHEALRAWLDRLAGPPC